VSNCLGWQLVGGRLKVFLSFALLDTCTGASAVLPNPAVCNAIQLGFGLDSPALAPGASVAIQTSNFGKFLSLRQTASESDGYGWGLLTRGNPLHG
jgi:hypothetical protein